MTNIDIFWIDGQTFTTVQDVATIDAALVKYNSAPTRHGKERTLADVKHYETIPDGQVTKFGTMFQD